MNRSRKPWAEATHLSGHLPFSFSLRNLALSAILFASVAAAPSTRAATNWTVVGWNNLGMHCMDADFSVFSILPPYNTIHLQLIDSSGRLVTSDAGLTVTYQAIADPSGSINRTSIGKGNFWQYVQPLFGVALAPDVGLPVPGPNSFAMPGTNNIPQAMLFDPGANWFAAYGIPITPYDDTLQKNPYPMMRLTARQGTAVLATTDIVLPVSDEMDCRACHATGSGPAAQPAGGGVNDPNPQRDYRLNILRFHDEEEAGNAAFTNALHTAGYNSNGLEATVTADGKPILCAACHLSEALPGSGQPGIKPLTEAVHGFHAVVTDPTNGMTLDASGNRSACYRCHPGSETKCLRGEMGRAVASDGTMAMQCHSCHGSMSAVGSPTRTGWLMEPNCQSCHSGDALSNNGQIRYTSVFVSSNVMRVAVNQRFATNPNTPAAGLSLYRFSAGHGGLQCSACHGSTHAEFATSHANDNITSIQHQGHAGTMVECNACHGAQPATISGGPHGMHPVGQRWVSGHADAVEGTGAAQCRSCHGLDYRGTVLSRSHADRTLNTEFGPKHFWRGFQIGCFACHNGPHSESASPNHPAVAANTSAMTLTNTSVAIPLTATDSDENVLTLRVVSQASHGTVGLVGTVATYFPEAGYVGGDTFTFAAWDGYVDSNLGTIVVSVNTGGGCGYSITPTSISVGASQTSQTLPVDTAAGCPWTAQSDVSWITIASGASGTGKGTVNYTVAPNRTPSTRIGTLTVAGFTFTVTQARPTANLTGTWLSLTRKGGGSTSAKGQKLEGQFLVENIGETNLPSSRLEFYLSDDNVLDENTDLLLKERNVGKLAAGGSKLFKLKAKLPVGMSAQGKYVIAEVDALSETAENNAEDNVVPYGPIP